MLSTGNLVLLVAPLAVGGVLAALNASSLNDAMERSEAWVRERQKGTSSSSNAFSKYAANPLLWVVVMFCDWTDGFAHRGLKNGVRVSATLYLVAVWLFLLFTALKVVLMLAMVAAVLYVFFKVLASSNDTVREGYESGRRVVDSRVRSEPEDVLDHVGLKGENVYSGTNWFNDELKGRVDDHGNIYRGTNWLNEERIGRIDLDGNVYRGTNFLNEEKVGHIDADGTIHKGTNWFNVKKTGRIDAEGNIHEGTNWFNEQKKGRTGN